MGSAGELRAKQTQERGRIFPRESHGMERWLLDAKGIIAERDIHNVTFRGIGAGDTEALQNGRVLEAAEVMHEKGEQCLAYRVRHLRRRLKREFASLSTQQVAEAVRIRPRDEIEETFDECELVYSGDTELLAPGFYQGAHVLIHEASFLYPAHADREKGLHSNIQEVLSCAHDAGVRSLVLFHSSRRYELTMLQMALPALIERTGIRCPVMLIRGSYNLPTD